MLLLGDQPFDFVYDLKDAKRESYKLLKGNSLRNMRLGSGRHLYAADPATEV